MLQWAGRGVAPAALFGGHRCHFRVCSSSAEPLTGCANCSRPSAQGGAQRPASVPAGQDGESAMCPRGGSPHRLLHPLCEGVPCTTQVNWNHSCSSGSFQATLSIHLRTEISVVVARPGLTSHHAWSPELSPIPSRTYWQTTQSQALCGQACGISRGIGRCPANTGGGLTCYSPLCIS